MNVRKADGDRFMVGLRGLAPALSQEIERRIVSNAPQALTNSSLKEQDYLGPNRQGQHRMMNGG